MKQFNLTTKSVKSLFLLLALLLGGTSPTWAQKALPYSYGFEDNNLATDGWTKAGQSNSSSSIGTSYAKTGSYGFRFYYDSNTSDSNPQCLVSPQLSINANASNIKVSFYYKTAGSYGPETFKVGYSTTDASVSSFTWDETVSTSVTAWTLYETSVSIPVGTKYIAIAYTATNKYYLYVDDINITCDINGPALSVYDGETGISSGYSYNFGLATAGTTKEFTLSNPGSEAAPVSVSHTGNFDAALSATSIPAGESVTLTVTMPDTTGDDVITISSTSPAIANFVINVSGTIRDANKVYLDFADGNLPDGWSWVATGSYASSYPCSVSEGYISWSQYGGSSYAWAFTSPKLNFEKDELIAFETARYGSSTYSSPSITVEYSLDGTTWTAIGSAFTDDVYGTWTKRSVTIPVEGVKYIRFNGWYIHMRNIYGGQEIPRPKNVTASDISDTGATIGWIAFGSETAWQVSYSTTSGAPASGTLVSAISTSKALTGLTALTTYYVSVRIDNGGGNYGEWSDEFSFTTMVAPITTYPYAENFNSLSANGDIPAYWDNSEGTTSNAEYKWSYNTSYGNGHEGKCVRFDSYSNYTGNTNFLKTRPFSFTEGQPMKLTFWYRNPNGGDFSVYASTDGGATYPTELATGLTGKSEWTEKEIEIPAAVFGNKVVIVFKGTSNYGSSDARIYLDDVTISEISAYSMAVSGSDVSENTIAFGTVKNTTTTKTFTITNDGGSDLTNISVVSSDAEVFTVSDTGFDLASGATKDITVTFVKAVDGEYSKTITISQANIATPIELTVTATYATPTPATMAVTLDDAAVGETVAFGIVGKATTKTFKVANAGEATLNATIAKTGTGAANFTLSAEALEVAGGAEQTFTITFDDTEYDIEKTATITLTAGELSKSFTVTGTRGDFWIEDFETASKSSLESDGWTVSSGWSFGIISDDPNNDTKQAYTGSTTSSYSSMITPQLEATLGDNITFDAYYQYGDEPIKVSWATTQNATSWTLISNENNGGNNTESNKKSKTITVNAPTTGKFYLKFESHYGGGIDNIVGFKLATATAHEAEVKTQTIPTSGNQYVEYTASIGVKVTGTSNESITVKFFIGETQIGDAISKSINSGEDADFEFTFTPNAAMTGDAYFTVKNADESINFESESKVAVTIAAATVLDEETAPTLAEGTLPSVVVKYTAKNGWNTICMPFVLTTDIMNSIFGTGWKAYEFKSYNGTELGFQSTTSFAVTGGYPYVVYVETAATHTDGVKLQNVNISAATAKTDEYGGAYFRGTYAPVAAGAWTKNADSDIIYGVTSDGHIKKAGSSASIKGFRAYFDLPAGANAPSISFEDTTTGITSLTPALSEGEGAVYNLNGQKVQNAQKGLYIVNGRKVVIK